jgi:hypothetical protein
VLKRASILTVCVAVLAAVAPIPPSVVEAWYSHGMYPRLQPVLTSISSAVPIALLDLAMGALFVAGVVFLVRRWRRLGGPAALRGFALAAIVTASLAYISFLACWGLNYRRVSLEERLAYDAAGVTAQAARTFAQEAVRQVNSLAAASRVPGTDAGLREAFVRAQDALGDPYQAQVARPKVSILSWYFRQSGVDGMTVPWFLEIILNPDVLPIERPFTLAHEWAHLAGYAHETDANFVAWVTCVGAPDAAIRYSGWLTAYMRVVRAVPPEDRRALREALDPAVRADLAAINERLSRANPAVSRAAMRAYDSYLRANRVEEGIASYGAVLRLMLGTRFDEGWRPRLR